MSRPRIHVGRDREAVLDQLADRLVDRLGAATERRGAARLALAGGGTPRPLYERLGSLPWRDRIDWARTELFWGDERCVPPDDPGSNYAMVREALLDRIPVPRGNIHRIRGELGPDAAAVEYAGVLGGVPLDLVLLGMGADGHTASIFPDTAVADAERERVLATRSPDPPRDRVSLGLGTLNAAREVAFLVLGGGKAARVAQVLRPSTAPLPAARVRPTRGALHWFLDALAARDLD